MKEQQTGLAHQTSLHNQQFIEDAVRTAVKLQNHIDKMYKVDFVKELYQKRSVQLQRKSRHVPNRHCNNGQCYRNG